MVMILAAGVLRSNASPKIPQKVLRHPRLLLDRRLEFQLLAAELVLVHNAKLPTICSVLPFIYIDIKKLKGLICVRRLCWYRKERAHKLQEADVAVIASRYLDSG
jgi:hypothetical protein